MDYVQRSEAWVNAHYVRTKARGGVGWADIPDLNIVAADRLAGLVRDYGACGGRMLEIGCGAGDISVLLAPKGLFNEIVGTDISETAIAWAQEKAKESPVPMSFRVDNMVHLREFADDSFDAIVAVACLHWIIGDDRADCLANVRRVLKPGGRFYVWTSGRSTEVIEPSSPTGESYFDPESGLLIRNGLPYFHLKLPEEVLSEIGSAGLMVLYSELGERDQDDGLYFSGPLIVVAAKPC
jgi:SAM-dependent methyltransferase